MIYFTSRDFSFAKDRQYKGVSPSGKAQDFDSSIVGSHTDAVGILRNAAHSLPINQKRNGLRI